MFAKDKVSDVSKCARECTKRPGYLSANNRYVIDLFNGSKFGIFLQYQVTL